MIISLQFVKVADTVFDYVIIILIWTSSEWIFHCLQARVVKVPLILNLFLFASLE